MDVSLSIRAPGLDGVLLWISSTTFHPFEKWLSVLVAVGG